MSNSFLEIIIKFIIVLIVLLGFSRVTFFNIDFYQAIAMALGITLVDFVAFLTRKFRSKRKDNINVD